MSDKRPILFSNKFPKCCSVCKITKDKEFFYPIGDSGRFLARCISCASEGCKAYASSNKQKRRLSKLAYARLNPEKIKRYSKMYYESHREQMSTKSKNYYRNNPEKIQAKLRHRYRTEPLYAFKMRLISRIYDALSARGWVKRDRIKNILGCEYETLKAHIESQFIDGMSWENRNQWHIDHRVPLASAKNEDDVLKLFHYKNLQPLWAKDNMRKGAKICG